MPRTFLTGLALLASLAGCQPTAPPETAAKSPAAPPAPMGAMGHPDNMGPMDHLATTSAPQSKAAAETMRQHDVLMGHLDSLVSEGQRLRQRSARLDARTPAGQRQAARLRRLTAALGAADAGMMGWMHAFAKVDTVGLSAHQYADFWADQQRQLHRLETQTRAALDSARRVR